MRIYESFRNVLREAEVWEVLWLSLDRSMLEKPEEIRHAIPEEIPVEWDKIFQLVKNKYHFYIGVKFLFVRRIFSINAISIHSPFSFDSQIYLMIQ